jgi:4-diphosphocytidyl-2-C-methyl-D-erythritol kinase
MALTRRATLQSLAKVNLDLRVLNKNRDGFHELRTVFQTISLADSIEVEFTAGRGSKVTIDDPLAIPGNLIVKAAEAVMEAGKIRGRVHFRFEKKIPMGGGLGGGSSNAASTLLALPVLAGKCVAMETLIEIGSELGSDVPFFLHGGTALGLGRGTELYALPDLREESILLMLPNVHVATGGAYQALNRNLTFTGMSSSINSFQAFVRALDRSRSAKAASALGANDFEAVVFTQYPQLKSIEAALSAKLSASGLLRQLQGIRMSGSGSTLFAVFESAQKRDRALKGLVSDPKFEGIGFVAARLVNRASYVSLWRRQLASHLAPIRSLKDKHNQWPPRSRYAQ